MYSYTLFCSYMHRIKYSFCSICNTLRSPGTGRPNARKRLWKRGRREDIRCITKYGWHLRFWLCGGMGRENVAGSHTCRSSVGNVIDCLSWSLEERSSVISENVDCTLLAIFSYRSTTPTGQSLHTGKYSIEHSLTEKERSIRTQTCVWFKTWLGLNSFL